MHAHLNLHLIFKRGEAFFTGAATSTIAQFRIYYGEETIPRDKNVLSKTNNKIIPSKKNNLKPTNASWVPEYKEAKSPLDLP